MMDMDGCIAIFMEGPVIYAKELWLAWCPAYLCMATGEELRATDLADVTLYVWDTPTLTRWQPPQCIYIRLGFLTPLMMP